MPISVVSSFAAQASAASVAVPVSGIQVGDLLVVASAVVQDTSNPVLGLPTDDQGNTYTQRVVTTWAAFREITTSLCDLLVTGTPPTTVTVNSTLGLGAAGVVLRVSGFAAGNYADQFAQGTALASGVQPSITTSVGGTRLMIVTLTLIPATANLLQAPQGYALMNFAAGNNPQLWVAAKTAAAGTTGPPDAWRLSAIADAAGCSAQYREGAQASDITRPPAGRGATW